MQFPSYQGVHLQTYDGSLHVERIGESDVFEKKEKRFERVVVLGESVFARSKSEDSDRAAGFEARTHL